MLAQAKIVSVKQNLRQTHQLKVQLVAEDLLVAAHVTISRLIFYYHAFSNPSYAQPNRHY